MIESVSRLADKSLRLNVNVVLGFQNVIGIIISVISNIESINISY